MQQSTAIEKMKSGKNVFLTGEPGAGKTYTVNQFVEWMKESGKSFALTASTGIAATHVDGNTIHSFTGMGIKKNLSDRDVRKIVMFKGDEIKEIDVLVVDEVSMLGAESIDDIDKILKGVHDNKLPFGGVQVILVGDFFQLPPITQPNQEVRFAFEAESWADADFEVCYLTEQHRQSEQVFNDVLAAMRSGNMTEKHKEILRKCTMSEEPETHLYTHNADVDRINQKKLDEIDEDEYSYRMTGSGAEKLVQALKRRCLSPEKLILKKGAVVMFTRNNFDAGYVNGTIGVVESASDDGMKVRLSDGRTISPEMAKWSFTNRHGKTKAHIMQFPLRLAWAITVHKSQGMSLDEASVDLSQTFEYGQGYVAISRVRSLDGLHLTGVNEMAFEVNPKILEWDKAFREQSG